MRTSAFRDLGIVANAAETHTCVLNKGTDGQFYFIVCARGFLVSTNLHTKETGFYPYPCDNIYGSPFGSYGSKTGKVYVGAGRYLHVFDPVQKEYTYTGIPHPDSGISCDAWTFTEADDGMIYFGAYPETYFTGFNPATETYTYYDIQDENQQYLGSVAVDNVGWAYCGMGTQQGVLTAVNLATKEKRVLRIIDGSEGICVCNAFDGNVYATDEGDTAFFPYNPNKKWYRLSGGEICEEMTEPFDNGYSRCGTGNARIHCPYAEHPEILYQDLEARELRYIHPDTGEETEVTLTYETLGANLSPISEGPDGKIYGTTNHPHTYFVYDPATDTVSNYGPGRKLTTKFGNICGFASHGTILAGAAYAGGHILRFDTTKPLATGFNENPCWEGSFDEILRPRSAAALPDGRRVVFGGYNAYGKTGGGLLIYDTVDRSCHLIKNEKLLPGQSVLSMVPLSETLLLCGTCIAAPGGGAVTAKEAELFLFDLKEEKVLWSMAPFAGVSTIAHMKMGTDGLVHGITTTAIHFVFDIEKREVVFTENLSEYGGVPRDGMKAAPDGTIWGLLNRAIYRIKPGTLGAEIVAKPPKGISIGLALVNDKLYFGNGSHLWEYTIQ